MISASKTTFSHYNLKILSKKFCEFQPSTFNGYFLLMFVEFHCYIKFT